MGGRLLRRAHGHALDAERAFRHLYVKAYRNAFLYGHYAERAMLLAIFAAIIVDPKGTELDVRAEAKAFGERYGFAWPRQSDFGVLSGRFRWIRWAKNINLLTEVRTPWPAGKFRQKLVSPEGGASGKTLIDLTRGSRKHSLLDGLASHLCES